MDLDRLKNIIDWMASQPLREIEIFDGDFSVSLVKNVKGVRVTSEPAEPTPAAQGSSHARRDNRKSTSHTEPGAAQIITAPIYGVLHLSPEPDSPAFVAIGDTVKAGQTLCLIEAMKVFNTVTAEHDGVIAELLASDGEEVSLGQSLFRLES